MKEREGGCEEGGFVDTGAARAGGCRQEAGGGNLNGVAGDAAASRGASRAARAAGALRVRQPPQKRQRREGCRCAFFGSTSMYMFRLSDIIFLTFEVTLLNMLPSAAPQTSVPLSLCVRQAQSSELGVLWGTCALTVL